MKNDRLLLMHGDAQVDRLIETALRDSSESTPPTIGPQAQAVIGQRLQRHYAALMAEPIPERFLTLLHDRPLPPSGRRGPR